IEKTRGSVGVTCGGAVEEEGGFVGVGHDARGETRTTCYQRSASSERDVLEDKGCPRSGDSSRSGKNPPTRRLGKRIRIVGFAVQSTSQALLPIDPPQRNEKTQMNSRNHTTLAAITALLNTAAFVLAIVVPRGLADAQPCSQATCSGPWPRLFQQVVIHDSVGNLI